MHITTDLKAFKDILEMVARISTKHLTLPALQCVLLEVSNGVLTIRATNLEIGIEGTLPVTEHAGGSVSVSASTLLQTVVLLSQKDVTLRLEGEVLMVETTNSKTTINTIAVDEFPHIPRVEGKGIVVHGKNFALGIRTTAFAASQSSIKPELGSIYIFQRKEQTLTFVATDSFRLIEKTTPQQQVVFDTSVLIPHKNAVELARICDLREENPTLFITENQCALQFKDVYITSRLTTGTFPDYEQIIPKEYQVHATLLNNDLQNALKKTNIFLNKFMQLTFTVDAHTLTLTSVGESGTTTESIKSATDGNGITLNFNQRYIQDVLQHIADDSLTIHFAGVGRPIVMEGAHDRSLRYLVMPMNK